MSHIGNNNQLDMFESPKIELNSTSTFTDNMKLPIHRWFRYTAGFSAKWVNEVIRSENKQYILDPFGGSGTVMLEGEFAGIRSIGIEAHPYIYKIAKAKLSWKLDPQEFKKSALALLNDARKRNVDKNNYPELIYKCYTNEVIEKLSNLKEAWYQSESNLDIKELMWFAITSILRTTSHVGTAQWQYILPNKRKGKALDAYGAYEKKIYEMVQDMHTMQRAYPNATESQIYLEDARNMPSVPDDWADLVITSPPYANNYDYADATRLEMSFWGDISNWGDLQEKVRRFLVTACTQHVSAIKNDVESLIESPVLYPIHEEISTVYENLAQIRLTKGGKKNYHLMILGYFHDLGFVFKELRRVTKNGSKMCFVIGDSAPYGIYVPVEKWLGKLAINAGFNSYSFEKLRDRNIKWKNRKHRVPLKEGRLWIEG